jgi:PhnB protein
MSSTSVKRIPDWAHTVTPHLTCAGAAKALDFYKAAFGAVELSRLPGKDGRLMHAAMRIGDSTIMLSDAFPEMGANGPSPDVRSPVTIHLYFDDVDAAAARAIAAGATITMPVSDMFWGDRYGQLVDPFGHRWSIATHIRDVTAEEMQQAMGGPAG